APLTVNVPFTYCADPAAVGPPISADDHPAGNAVLADTVIDRAADVVVAPALSRATAVSEYVPAATLLHVTLYGDAVADPISVVPLKKSTRAIVPSGSLAVAVSGTVAGAV